MSRKCDHDWFDHYKVSRGFQIETPFLSHVSGRAWNAAPFDSPKFSHQTVSTV